MAQSTQALVATMLEVLRAQGFEITAATAPVAVVPARPATVMPEAFVERAIRREAQGHPVGRRAEDRKLFNRALSEWVTLTERTPNLFTDAEWNGWAFRDAILSGSDNRARRIADSWGILSLVVTHA